jgi:hypothetical protein
MPFPVCQHWRHDDRDPRAGMTEGTADMVEDQMAMDALLRCVPLEMGSSLASKSSAKVA